jgi:CTP-dependent riboflavin kinase
MGELSRRSGVGLERTEKVLEGLKRQNLIFTEYVKGESVFHLTESGITTLEWEIRDEQKKAKSQPGVSSPAYKGISVGDQRRGPGRNMAANQPVKRQAVA